jgi:hypothetical protein
VEIADRADDLLVVSSGRLGRLHRVFEGAVARHCRAHATCPVATVPPSELLETLERTVRDGETLSLPRPFAHAGR